jgi:hypothetical protein
MIPRWRLLSEISNREKFKIVIFCISDFVGPTNGPLDFFWDLEKQKGLI